MWLTGKRSTRFTVSIFELTGGVEVAGVQATSEGGHFTLIVPLLLGWGPATESSSCDALGAEVARAIGGKARDEDR